MLYDSWWRWQMTTWLSEKRVCFCAVWQPVKVTENYLVGMSVSVPGCQWSMSVSVLYDSWWRWQKTTWMTTTRSTLPRWSLSSSWMPSNMSVALPASSASPLATPSCWAWVVLVVNHWHASLLMCEWRTQWLHVMFCHLLFQSAKMFVGVLQGTHLVITNDRGTLEDQTKQNKSMNNAQWRGGNLI